jgi:hypothetical protein
MRAFLLSLLVIVAVATIGWLAWWPVAAWHDAATLERWREARVAEGWQADWRARRLGGFPERVEIHLIEPAVADPDTGWAWQAPGLVRVRARLAPWTDAPLRILLPARQRVASPTGRVDITSEALEARLWRSGRERRLLRAELDIADLVALSTADWQLAIGEGRIAARALEDAPQILALSLDMRGVVPPARLIGVLERAGQRGAVIQEATGQVRVTFDRPWDARALDVRRPQPERVTVERLAMRWGELELEVAGALEIDAEGRPEGQLTVRVTRWREWLAAAEASGALPGGLRRALEAALEGLSQLQMHPRQLDVPLRFEGDRIRLGPVPIAASPVLRLP